ncbi:hypothetical protein [Roseisolibacter sp. H3M3-2]|uniref:hypothetical protein n=1 Tax=Roseisolibacter sp. H3M3-2 TaxID=3031323 RepID=UPI0023DC1499|nr:hypothetical protein [Roseisolibacter sp. H3M3-2]MDF1504607.1 hypothetical protein [Roseisolibacter sp. H3M3-2]
MRALLLVALLAPALAAQPPRVTVTLPAGRAAAPVDGRLLFLVSADTAGEPRNQVSDAVRTAQVYGMDVEGWRPGTARTVDGTAFGYPLPALSDLKPGRYRVQALVNRYETFRRADGHTVKLPPDRGEGQQWASKPGNLYSRPQAVTVGAGTPIALTLDQEIPPVADFAAKETPYVKYVRIRSERLSRFWGRDMHLAAWVLLPWGYDAHPGARYPLVVNHGHFPSGVDGWRETPPDSTLAPDFSARFNLRGYNRIQQELSYQLYRDWTGPGFPRVLLVQIQHATPFYDDSYAVNSANNGPYGDAIQRELLPEIERRFRGIGEGWARFAYGGSTGGWEALAVQTFYPDEYNGAWVACPDPIDFRAYTTVDIYADTNAYWQAGPFKRVPRPGHRNWLGHVDATLEQMNHRELALGSRGRSGDQWDVWQSVFSPVGADGYPKPIWDKRTGTIDRAVAAHWREHFDLTHILRRDWKTLGPKLRGKLRIYVGDMDNYYLNNAVYLTEQFLREADPPADAVVDYGDRAEHCWNGDHTRSNAYSRLRYPQMVLPWAVERMLRTAPAGADLRSWRY